uniref:BTB domain-containing protein n=1 Tax=Pyrodinium bahamense TaxID=73915 RepID=A0A7S0A4F9_9DINO
MEARLSLPRRTSSGRFRLEGFSSLLELHRKDEEVSSGPIIDVGGEKFDIVVYPAGNEGSHPGFVGVYVGRIGGRDAIRGQYTLSLVSQTGHKRESRSRVDRFKPNVNNGFPNFVEAAELKDPSKGLAADDVVTIEASVTIFGERTIDIRPCSTQGLQPTAEVSLAANLAELWKSGWWTDLTLMSGGRELRAHRLILAARSPVFERMLSSKMREASTGHVEIPDIAPEVLQRLCEFIYTDNVEDEEVWNDDEAIRGLLLAAKKYELPGLVKLCAGKALMRLQAPNAASWLILASQLEEEDFKDNCLRYVVDHLSEVQDSEGWEQLMRNKRLLSELAPALFRGVCPPAKKRRPGGK